MRVVQKVHSVTQLATINVRHIFGSGTDPITLHVVVVIVLIGAILFQKSLRLCHFKLDRDKIWQDCSSSKYASIDESDF